MDPTQNPAAMAQNQMATNAQPSNMNSILAALAGNALQGQASQNMAQAMGPQQMAMPQPTDPASMTGSMGGPPPPNGNSMPPGQPGMGNPMMGGANPMAADPVMQALMTQPPSGGM